MSKHEQDYGPGNPFKGVTFRVAATWLTRNDVLRPVVSLR